MYHSLWSVTLPTCHMLSPPTVTSPQDTEEMTDSQYAKFVKFLASAPIYKSKLTPPPLDIDANLYLVGKDPYDASKPPFQYHHFEKHLHTTPDVLWFQPYSKNPSALNHALTLGLLIESGDLDGTVIPLPNIQLSLTENNSMFLQGTLPLSHVFKYIPSTEDNNRFRLCKRKVHDDQHQPVGFALRDCSTVFVPRFGTEMVRANMHSILGAVVHNNCNDNEIDFTFAASSHPSPPPVPEDSIYLWSSYRYVSLSNTNRRKVYLYYTLRQFYGENVTLSRTRNPTLLIP